MNPRSLRFRLTVWHTTWLTTVFVLLGALLFVQVKGYLEKTLQDTQARRARQIGETLIASIPRTGEASVAAAIENLYAPELSDRFIRITRQDGSVLYLSGPPSDQNFDPAKISRSKPEAKPEFLRHVTTPGGSMLLLAAFRAVLPSGSYLVEVGAPADPVDSFLRRLALLLGLGLPIVVLVAAGGGYALVGRALRPVALMAGKAEVITQHNLTERLPVVATGDELEKLAVSLNHMITRLDDSFQNSRRFVADASHELRTPLTILRGELEFLAQEQQVPLALADRLGSVLEEVERLAKIVERLLVLSRLDAGEGQAEWIRFDLAELAAGTAEQMTLLAEDEKIAMTCDASRPVAVKGDRARLKQVIVNLLDNAIKYTPSGGAVRLSVCEAGTWACLEVTDTGVGIAADALSHVFDRFFRADSSRSREPDGVGLGLAIVKSICGAHGGTIEAESAPGRGSRFLVRLPLAVNFPPIFSRP